MKITQWQVIFCLLLTGQLTLSRAGWEAFECRQHLRLADPADGTQALQYAPDRNIDILHMAIDVTPNFKQRSIQAQTTIRFKPIAKPFPELKLDAVKLSVQDVKSSAPIQAWQSTDEHVIVTFAEPIPPDRETTVTFKYDATPAMGLYFRTPEMGYHPDDLHVWTQGESIEARHWFPSFDSPNEKFTSEVTCRVPEGMVVLSNGRQVSSEKDPDTGLVAVKWLQDKPHVTYLIALAAGHFKGIEDRYKDIPLAFYTPASQFAEARYSFDGTKEMMAFFEEEIGIPYPWHKYYQVCVQDFVAGGMENTTLTILTDQTLHTPEFETLRDSQGLVAHELAHQWFGDLVTCKDWANLWINEGFATYYEALYDGHRAGSNEFLYSMYQSGRHVVGQPNQTNAIVRRDYKDPGEQFSYLAYPKGGWVLHMLRSQLGPDLYRRCIKTFLERHAYGSATTEDLNAVLEELSGRSFDRFFDQWVYHAGYPDLAVSYSWDERAKLARISVQQNQKLSEDVLLFHFPLTIRFKTDSGIIDRQVTIDEKSEDFYFALPSAPKMVRIDPNLTVLAKIQFTPPGNMLFTQLADTNDLPGRLIAAEQLGSRKDAESIRRLEKTLNQDPFYGVRMAAAQALRSIGTDEAIDTLLRSSQQTNAHVRRQVLSDLGSLYRPVVLEAARQALQSEKNPDIQAAAIKVLGAYPMADVRDTLLKYLCSESFRNVLADAAVGAIRSQDDPSYIAPLRQVLRERAEHFTTGGFGRALEAVAYLARNQEQKDDIRELLFEHVNSKRMRVQLAAIGALGTLGDPKAIAVLERFTSGPKASREYRAAERALAELRDPKKAPGESGTLRNEVLKLQRENRDLRKDFDDLKKKVEALTPVVSPATPTNIPTRKPTSAKPPKQSNSLR